VRNLGAEALVFDDLCQQLPHCGFSKTFFVVSSYGAHERAKALIDRGAPRVGVMFCDQMEQDRHGLASRARKRGREFLMSLLEYPLDPLLEDYVRPALFWAYVPLDLIDCGDEEIGEAFTWSLPSIAVWAVDDRTSDPATFFAPKTDAHSRRNCAESEDQHLHVRGWRHLFR
jgi:hypothetical protein